MRDEVLIVILAFNEQDKINLSRNEIWNTDTIKVFIEKLNGDWDWLKYRNL